MVGILPLQGPTKGFARGAQLPGGTGISAHNVSGQAITQLAALGTEISPTWPGVLEVAPGRLVMFMPSSRYTYPAVLAGISIGAGYLALAVYVNGVVGLNPFFLLGWVAGGLALAYIAGQVGEVMFNNAFIRATVRHPKVVLSIDLVSTNSQRIRAWYRFPIRLAGEDWYSREASHLWIRADPKKIDAIVGLAPRRSGPLAGGPADSVSLRE